MMTNKNALPFKSLRYDFLFIYLFDVFLFFICIYLYIFLFLVVYDPSCHVYVLFGLVSVP